MRRQRLAVAFSWLSLVHGGHARSVASKEELASTMAAMAPSATRAAAASPSTTNSIGARALQDAKFQLQLQRPLPFL